MTSIILPCCSLDSWEEKTSFLRGYIKCIAVVFRYTQLKLKLNFV